MDIFLVPKIHLFHDVTFKKPTEAIVKMAGSHPNAPKTPGIIVASLLMLLPMQYPNIVNRHQNPNSKLILISHRPTKRAVRRRQGSLLTFVSRDHFVNLPAGCIKSFNHIWLKAFIVASLTSNSCFRLHNPTVSSNLLRTRWQPTPATY